MGREDECLLRAQTIVNMESTKFYEGLQFHAAIEVMIGREECLSKNVVLRSGLYDALHLPWRPNSTKICAPLLNASKLPPVW